MRSVFATPHAEASAVAFPQVAPSSSTGGVAQALCCKGANLTLAPGPHAGIQAVAFAYRTLLAGRAKAMLAGGADEVYDQMYWNYDYMDYLWPDADADRYRLRADHALRKVPGEGAGILALEPLEEARARGATPLAEVLGYAMNADADEFERPCLNPRNLCVCCRQALARAGIAPDEVDLLVWAPQGNSQDNKTLDALRDLFGPDLRDVPLVTTTFNTGYAESASILISLVAALSALRRDGTLWPQMTGEPWIDGRPMARPIRHVLALGSTDIGVNSALVLRTGDPG